MILIWGIWRDHPIASVYDALVRQGCHPRFLDQEATAEVSAEMRVGSDISALLRTGEGAVDLRDVTAAYMRPYDPRDLPAVRRAGPGSETWDRALLLDDFLASWAELTETLIVNRPSAMVSNSSKPFQAKLLRDFGFRVPDTIITTDPQAVAEFRERHRRVVYKSISSVRSIVSELTDKKMSRIGDVCWCPTQFQELVPGTDYRVHVVGDEVFASKIETEAVDYRYSARQNCDIDIRAAVIPDEVAQRCTEASREMGLAVSGVDLRRTADGEWYCFEINPSPAFTFYQSATGQRIDEAMARLLGNGSTPGTAGGRRQVVAPGRS
jgi:RimK-like ATP-grasp domain